MALPPLPTTLPLPAPTRSQATLTLPLPPIYRGATLPFATSPGHDTPLALPLLPLLPTDPEGSLLVLD
jgi:hypothetical protein